MSKKDFYLLLILAACAAALHAPALFGGRTYFLGDLTHVSLVWRGLSAEALTRGELPVWNPYAHCGLPLWANMQTAVLHPFALLGHLFPFPTALGWMLWLAQSSAALWTYLWQRRLGRSRAACFAAAAVFSLGGPLTAFAQFPNLQAAAASLPALLLFAPAPFPLGLAAAFGFLAGYPPAWGFSAAAALILFALFEKPGAPRLGKAAAAIFLGIAACAAIWLPGWEFFRHSSRSDGISRELRLNNSVETKHLLGLARPDLARAIDGWGRKEDPMRLQVDWREGEALHRFNFVGNSADAFADAMGSRWTAWSSLWLGLVGALLALAGLRGKEGWAWTAVLAASLLIVLGGSNRVSSWLWEAPIFDFIRGPARLNFLPVFAGAALAAAGLRGVNHRTAGVMAVLAALELISLGAGFQPTLSKAEHYDAGPAARFLGMELKGMRYAQRPQAEAWAFMHEDDERAEYARFRKAAWLGFKQKLFGVSGAMSHLASATGGFESLLPAGQEKVLVGLTAGDEAELARRMPWAGARIFFDPRNDLRPPLQRIGKKLWEAYEGPPAALAWSVSEKDQERLLGSFSDAPESMGKPWQAALAGYDRVELSGAAEERGALYLAFTRYPGWELYLDGKRVETRSALDAFALAPVEGGEHSAVWLYRAKTIKAGLAVTILALLIAAGAACARLRNSYTL